MMDRKKIIKTFGGFQAVMLIFTILSRAVSGASMARVETVKVAVGTIEHNVTASGKAEAGKEAAVYTESNQRVKEICVQEGESVEAGEVLFRIDTEELEEQILQARQELEKTKLQSQDAQNAKAFERSGQATARQRAQEDYNQAVAQGDSSVAEAKKAWDDAQWALQEFLNSSADTDGGTTEIPSDEGKPQEEPSGEGTEGADTSSGGKGTEGVDTQLSGEESEGEDNSSGEKNKDKADSSSGQANLQNTKDSEAEREQKKAALEQAVAEAKAAYDNAVSSRADNIRTATRALEDAARPQSASDSTEKQNEITRQQQDLALNKLLSLQEAGGEIKAPVSGVITQILITTGDFTSEGAAMRVADTSGGVRVVLSVDKSNEQYVGKGSPIKLKVSGSKETMDGYTVSGVTVNEQDNTLLDVVVDLPEGVLEAGTLVEAEIVPKSESYSCVVPLQALHEEQNGSYVLILQEEQGVLGTELVAKRLDVQVLDRNNTNAALEEGLLAGDQEIISSSSRMIQEGSRVRRKEG